MTRAQALQEFLQQFFLERGVVLPEDWQAFNFIAAGVLDSFEILSMIVSLETHFALTIPSTLLTNADNARLGTFVAALLELA